MYKLVYILLLIIFLGACAPKNTTEKSIQELALKERGPVVQSIQDFTLGPNDEVSIMVYRHEELSSDSYRVRPNGTISIPLAGEINITGLSVPEIERRLEKKLEPYVVSPKVSVNVVEIKSAKAYLLGEINTPGAIVLDERVNLLEALASAGGPTDDAKKDRIILIRNDNIKVLNYKKILEGDFTQNTTLQRKDIIYVPPTKLASISRFLTHISRIIGPVVSLESGITLYPRVKQAILTGESSNDSQDVSIIPPTTN